MLFPEALYELSARDRQVTWLDPGMFGFPQLRSTAVGVNGSVSQQVPDGRVLLLFHACAFFDPAAAGTSTLRRLLIRPPVALTQEIWLRESRDIQWPASSNPANQNYELTFSGSLAVPPLWFVQAYGEFSAAAGNEIALNIAGMLIPAGNIQRV